MSALPSLLYPILGDWKPGAPSHKDWQLDEEHKDTGPNNPQPLIQGYKAKK